MEDINDEILKLDEEIANMKKLNLCGKKIIHKKFGEEKMEFENFLNDIKRIFNKIPKKEKTFMEISGYPHYENVCSNILAFYLNPNEEHGFNDMILNTFLETIKSKGLQNIVEMDNPRIFREYVTDNGNRIDIVIESDDMVIGIENKINAEVYNDLSDYGDTLESINQNSIKILLSIRDENEIANENGFINITYNDFFEVLKRHLENYDNKSNKWYIFLIDFIKNIEGYKVESIMEEEIKTWIRDNKSEVNQFFNIINVARNNINEKAEEYERKLKEKIGYHYNIKNFNDSEDMIAVGKCVILNCGCNIDVCLNIDVWKVSVFAWKNNYNAVKKLLTENGYNIIDEYSENAKKTHFVLYEFDYDCNIDEIVNIALKLLRILK